MKIEITLRPGSESVAFFADVTLDDKINLLGCPIFRQVNGGIRVGMPSRKTEDGKHYPVVSLAPSLQNALEIAVVAKVSDGELKAF